MIRLVAKVINGLLSPFGIILTRVKNDVAYGATGHSESVKIGKFDLTMPADGLILASYRANPNYGSEIGIIAKSVFSKYPELVIIDVGANVGDTAAIIRSSVPSPIIVIEGDPVCVSYLEENLKVIPDVELIPQYLSDIESLESLQMEKAGWNTTLRPIIQSVISNPTENIQQIRLTTLDALLKVRDDRNRIKLIKVDTEGYDFKVVRGGEQIVHMNSPVLFFEVNREGLDRVGENGDKFFKLLRSFGYALALVWDTAGRLLLSTSLDGTVIADLYSYIGKSSGSMTYFDICVFHSDDEDIHQEILGEAREAREKLVSFAK